MKSLLRYLPRQHGYIQAQVAVAVQAPACPGVGAQNLCRVIRCQAAALFLAVGRAAQDGAAQLVQLPQQGRKALLVALILCQQSQRPVGVALGRVTAQRFRHAQRGFRRLVVPAFQRRADMPLVQKGQFVRRLGG